MRVMERGEDRGQAIRVIVRLLGEFCESGDPFLISNESLGIVVKELGERLIRAAEEGDELRLLQEWRNGVDSTRKEILSYAGKNSASFQDGRSLPVMTENLGRMLVKLCPDKPRFPKVR